MSLRRLFTLGFLCSIGIVALVGIIMLLIPRAIYAEEVLFTCLLAAAFNLIAALQSLFFFRGRLKNIAWVGLTSASISLCCLLILTWVPYNILGQSRGEFISRAAGFTAVTAGWTTITGLLLIMPICVKWTILLRRGVIILVTIPAAFGLWATIEERSLERAIDLTVGQDFFGRLLGVDSILLTTGLITLIVMALAERRNRLHQRESLERRIHVSITCPRCKSEQEVPTGHGKCTKCGLNITIEVDEPRCTCGYLLHELRSQTCPECGRKIPTNDQWPWAGQSEALKPNLNA